MLASEGVLREWDFTTYEHPSTSRLLAALSVELWRAQRFNRPLAAALLAVGGPQAPGRREVALARGSLMDAALLWAEDHVRLSDALAPLNAHELLFVLPETSREGARRIALRLIRSAEIAQRLADVRALGATPTFGAATARATDDVPMLIQRARDDAALHASDALPPT